MSANAKGCVECARLLMVGGADKEARNDVRVARCLAVDLLVVVVVVVGGCLICGMSRILTSIN